MICCFLPAFQESTSLKELHMDCPFIDGSSNLALESMLTHTQSLQSLSFICRAEEDIDVAAVLSGLINNTTLRELTLECSQNATTISPIFTSVRDHPLLQRLCLNGDVRNLTGLETVLQSHTSKITELDIHRSCGGPPIIGLTSVLQALARRPTLTKLELRWVRLGRVDARQLGMVLYSTPSLQSLVLRHTYLGSAGLTELAPALQRNTSIKVLDLSWNDLNDMDSARLLRDIIHNNKTMTALDLSYNRFGVTAGAVELIADGLGSNSTLLKIDLTCCALGDVGISVLAQTLGSRNTTLQKLNLGTNAITSTGVGVLLETMEQSHHITDLDLRHNPIRIEGASLVARFLGNNALPSLISLSLYRCSIGDDGFTVLMSALEQNTSLLHLDLRHNGFSERVWLALAESQPEIKVLQQVDFDWCTGLASAMPSLLVGLRENTSLFHIHVAGCAPSSVPPTPEDNARCAGGWIQDMERLGYRNRFRSLIRAPEERLPPRGVWPHALARVATHPDVIFYVLRSKPKLVPSEDEEGKEAVTDTGKRKRGDE